jgi:Amt family ammonium transporter
VGEYEEVRMRRLRRVTVGSLLLGSLSLQASPVAAADGAEVSAGDTAWLLVATAMVMVMLPGLALFYGGLVRRKNVLSTIMHSFFGLAIVSVVWVLWGFSLAFGPTTGGLIGNLDFLGLSNVGLEPDARYAGSIPFVLFASFQLMFAAITPALITGAFAERKRFGAFVLFTVLWSTLVYSPLAHWVWAPGGWLRELGALDYAGGTVVHISSGISALVAALLIGRRVTNGDRMEPHDVPMTVLGAGLLWFGWFGFNAGSALAATGQAANALLVTNTAAGAATLAWVAASYMHKRKVSVVGAACGAVAGLVAITPASGFVTAGGAVVIGLAVGGLCYSATLLRSWLRIDDALDVFAVHGVGGVFGAVATGVLAVAAIGGVSGAIEGNFGQVVVQLVAIGATVSFAATATFVIVKVIDLILGLRVAADAEEVGLDLAVHGEVAYQP